MLSYDESKKRIIETISKVTSIPHPNLGEHTTQCLSHSILEKIADALLEDGFDYKDAFDYRANLLLIAGKKFEEERDNETIRAIIAEKALHNLARFCATRGDISSLSDEAVVAKEKEVYEFWLKQAEQEVLGED